MESTEIDLLPFLWMRPAHMVPPRQLTQRFVLYPYGDQSSFVASLTAPGADKAALAQTFMDGSAFIGSLQSLGAPYALFPAFDLSLIRRTALPVDTPSGLDAIARMEVMGIAVDEMLNESPQAVEIVGSLARTTQALMGGGLAPAEVPFSLDLALRKLLGASPKDWVAAPDYAAVQIRLWDSLFACVLSPTPPINLTLEADLVMTLRISRLIERMAADDPTLQSRGALGEAARATVVLPATVFPGSFPPALPPDSLGSLQTIAVAERRRIVQRTLRYDMGEIARVENVLRSERRETLRRSEQTRESASETSDDSESELSRALHEAAGAETLPDGWTLTRTYETDALKATVVGSLTQNGQPAPSPQDFAKRLTADGVRRLTRRMASRREESRRGLEVSQHSHAFDNSQGASDVVGVYRWLDKVGEARLVSDGFALMLEFVVPEPAQAWIQTLNALQVEPLAPPPLPASLNPPLTQPSDLDAETYAAYAAAYGITVPPPPPAQTTVSAVLSSEMAAPWTEIPLPEGYSAETAWVSGLPAGGTGFVGRQALAAGPLTLNGETGSIAAAITASGSFAIGIEIGCALAAEGFSSWQLSTYNALIEAWKRQEEAYGQRYEERITQSERNAPARNLALIRSVLRQGCLRRLLGQPVGPVDATQPAPAMPPRLMQFFEEAIRWDELAFWLEVSPWGTPPALPPHWRSVQALQESDPLVTRFLEANAARVLISVRPGFESLMLFYLGLAGASTWTGGNETAPGLEIYLPPLNDLKNMRVAVNAATTDETWAVVEPTAMMILQDSPSLGGRA